MHDVPPLHCAFPLSRVMLRTEMGKTGSQRPGGLLERFILCSGQLSGRGKSGLHRAGCWLTARRGNPTESATETSLPGYTR